MRRGHRRPADRDGAAAVPLLAADDRLFILTSDDKGGLMVEKK